MGFRIKITRSAKQDIREAVAFIRENSPEAAEKWLADLNRIQLSLRENPNRFALIQEADILERPYRSVRHYSHRVIFRVNEENRVVHLVRVYHGARKPLNPDQLESE